MRRSLFLVVCLVAFASVLGVARARSSASPFLTVLEAAPNRCWVQFNYQTLPGAPARLKNVQLMYFVFGSAQLALRRTEYADGAVTFENFGLDDFLALQSALNTAFNPTPSAPPTASSVRSIPYNPGTALNDSVVVESSRDFSIGSPPPSRTLTGPMVTARSDSISVSSGLTMPVKKPPRPKEVPSYAVYVGIGGGHHHWRWVAGDGSVSTFTQPVQ